MRLLVLTLTCLALQANETVEAFFNAFAANNPTELAKYIAPNCAIENASEVLASGYTRHAEMSRNLLVRMRALHNAFPDLALTVADTLEEGDRVFVRFALAGTHKGTFLGAAPTGKPIVLRTFAILRIVDGRIVSISEMANDYSVMKQLGSIPL